MSTTRLPLAGAALALLTASPVLAQNADARLEQLQAQMEAMQRAFEQQIGAMQREIDELRRQDEAVQSVLEPPPPSRERDEEITRAIERAGIGTEPIVRSAEDGISLTISGQVNRALNVADDGNTTKAYFVDNDASNSRVNLLGEAPLSDEARVNAQIEVAFSPNNSADVSQEEEDTGDDFIDDRIVEIGLEHDRYGVFAFGKGSGAADDTAEFDLSGTDVVMYSDLAAIAGGLLFSEGGDYGDTTIADAFSNFDGDRQDRIRYDTPIFGPGLQAAASFGEDQRWDAAFSIGNDFGEWTGVDVGPFTTLAAVSVSDPSEDDIDYQYDGSVSALHNPTGLNVTFSAGSAARDEDSDPYNLYGKVGWQTELTELGDTSFGVDLNRSVNLPTGSDDGWSTAAAVVQEIADYGIDLYAQLRWFTLDRGDGPSVDDILLGTVGSRIVF